MYLAVVFLALTISLLIAERLSVRRAVETIRVRIHINGTRGKSSVARYIAAALRASGMKIVVKVTGTVPTVVLPDGTEEQIRRRGSARVQEQFGIMRRAAALGVECLVLECMSISPELQRLEGRVFAPHIMVITNVRDDHQEAMGSRRKERVDAVISAIPRNAVVVTGESDISDEIAAATGRKNGRAVIVRGLDEHLVRLLPDGVFAENIALAAAAANLAGIETDAAIRSILDSIDDAAGRLTEIPGTKGTLLFVDGFSVNDPESAREFVEYWMHRLDHAGSVMVILNTRADRPLRSMAFAAWLANAGNISKIIITGSHSPAVRRNLLSRGFAAERIAVWTESQIAQARSLLAEMVDGDSVVFGLGNIVGSGFTISGVLRRGNN